MNTAIKKDKLVKLDYTEHGLFLQDSILGFDSTQSSMLSFLSSASLIPKDQTNTKFIATEETVRILNLKKKNLNSLSCQYNRAFSIGSLKMELLPSGSSFGGSSLYVEHNKVRILYAPYICLQKFSTLRQFQLKKASVLILGAFVCEEETSGIKSEKERLLHDIKSYVDQKIYPIIMCSATPIAQEIVGMLSSENIPVATHSSITAVNKIYEFFGSNIGKYSLYSKYTKNKVVILPYSVHRSTSTTTPVLNIQDSTNSYLGQSNSYLLNPYCTVKDLKEIISVVCPKEIYIIGPYTKTYCQRLHQEGISTTPLYPNGQQSLF